MRYDRKKYLLLLIEHWQVFTILLITFFFLLLPAVIIYCQLEKKAFKKSQYTIVKYKDKIYGGSTGTFAITYYTYKISLRKDKNIKYTRERLFFSCTWWTCSNNMRDLENSHIFYAYIYPSTQENSVFAISVNHPSTKIKLWFDLFSYVSRYKYQLLVYILLLSCRTFFKQYPTITQKKSENKISILFILFILLL